MLLNPDGNNRRLRLMAISSGGGHWVQLLRLKPAFDQCDVAYVTVQESYRAQVGDHRFYTVNDATRWNKLGLIRLILRLAWIVAKERPQVVISTGAAPGFIALRLARLFGARTIWLDSIANAEELSLSGQMIGRHADLWLTQWQHLGRPDGPHFAGSVL
jgi:UDP-N-acetylglucosamine:LPS N-acetylglucosamine transferase